MGWAPCHTYCTLTFYTILFIDIECPLRFASIPSVIFLSLRVSFLDPLHSLYPLNCPLVSLSHNSPLCLLSVPFPSISLCTIQALSVLFLSSILTVPLSSLISPILVLSVVSCSLSVVSCCQWCLSPTRTMFDYKRFELVLRIRRTKEET